MKKNIIIVRGEHVCSNTLLLINKLRKSGLFNLSLVLINIQGNIYLENLLSIGDLFIVKIDSISYGKNFFAKVLRKLISIKILSTILLELELKLTANKLNNNFRHKVINEKDIVIGIEKVGLIYANLIYQKTRSELIYYSLELYFEDYSTYKFNNYFSWLRKKEKTIHSYCKSTIIQDPTRAKVLFNYNSIDGNSQKIIYLPVSVSGGQNTERSAYYKNKFNISNDKYIILYFGNTLDIKVIKELVSIADKLDNKFVIIMQCNMSRFPIIYGNPIFKKKYSNILFNIEFIIEEDLPKIISSATIGLALYPGNTYNERLTAFSSGKIAYYCQSGIPFIAFKNNQYSNLKEEFACTELIASIEELPDATKKILENYDGYRRACFCAFNKYYNFDKNVKSIIQYLSD